MDRLDHRSPSVLPPLSPDTELRRVVVALSDGACIEVAQVDGRTEAVRVARETIHVVDEAQRVGTWPTIAGRELDPSTVVSIDVERRANS
jgi:hypothetical protein